MVDNNDDVQVFVPEGAMVQGIRDDQARVDVTWAGQQSELPDPVPRDADAADVKQWVTEALRAGDIPGLGAHVDADLTDYVVKRYPPHEQRPYHRIELRPKTPFGMKPDGDADMKLRFEGESLWGKRIDDKKAILMNVPLEDGYGLFDVVSYETRDGLNNVTGLIERHFAYKTGVRYPEPYQETYTKFATVAHEKFEARCEGMVAGMATINHHNEDDVAKIAKLADVEFSDVQVLVQPH